MERGDSPFYSLTHEQTQVDKGHSPKRHYREGGWNGNGILKSDPGVFYALVRYFVEGVLRYKYT